MFDLTSRTALVTGASGGIGSAVARSLHDCGARVVLAGRRRDVLEKIAGELGADTCVVTAAQGTAEGDEELVRDAIAAGGTIDILVNNAGVTADSLAMRMKDDDWQRVIDVNLTSGFRIARGLLRGMLKRRFGRIIGITSVIGMTGNQGQSNYAASKAGVMGMTRSIAQEVAKRGITVNCVAPGFISTAMTDVLSDDLRQSITHNIPMERIGSPPDVAAAVVYLASNEAGYVTGQTIHVNGGLAMY